MTTPEDRVRAEIAATVDRGGFDGLSPDALRPEVTDSLRRMLGACVPLSADDDARFAIRIAARLFEMDDDAVWRDTVRHEVAHAHVRTVYGTDPDPHGEAWQAAAERAGATPTARYHGDSRVDPDFVLACPRAVPSGATSSVRSASRTPGCTAVRSVRPR